MSGAHTPGPWEVSYNDDSGEHVIRMGEAIETPWTHPVEEVIRYDHGLYEDQTEDAEQFAIAEANAHLIASAPELLDALRSAIGAMEVLDHPEDFGALAKARAAIAKATGK